MTPRNLRVVVARPRPLSPDPYTDRMLRRVILLCFAGMAAEFASLVFLFAWLPVGAHWLLTASHWTGYAGWLTIPGIWISVIQLWLHRRLHQAEPPGESQPPQPPRSW